MEPQSGIIFWKNRLKLTTQFSFSYPYSLPNQESMCCVPPFHYKFFLCGVPPQYRSVPLSIHTDTLPQLKYHPCSTCISECGTPSWACSLYEINAFADTNNATPRWFVPLPVTIPIHGSLSLANTRFLLIPISIQAWRLMLIPIPIRSIFANITDTDKYSVSS